MDSVVEATGIYLGTLVVGIVSGLIPLVNGEVFVVGAIKLFANDLAGALAVAVLMAIGQMIAKVVLFQAARKTSDVPSGKFAEKLQRARARIERWRKKPLTILFVSASVGLPPFYLVSIAAGVLGVRFWTFVWIGLAGRTIRFGVLAFIVNYA